MRGSGIQLFLIAGVVVVRYILLPIVRIVIVKGALYSGLVHVDPLSVCSPSTPCPSSGDEHRYSQFAILSKQIDQYFWSLLGGSFTAMDR